jgi:hypothetical protein|tara:strand:- start:310 stop:672 length:363 start_codon:yes stop_codon:yes gene_type:complete
MATKLDKEIIRETDFIRDDRNVNITLTPEQKIVLKLKGMKSGELTIGIDELYDKLSGKDESVKKPVVYTRKDDGKYEQPNPKIAKTVLSDLRSQNAISGMDLDFVTKFDSLVKMLLDSYR